MHGPSTLLYIHELLAFLSHHACWNVVGAESAAKLSPRHLVVCEVSDSVVGPPRADVAMQLLCGEEGLLHLRALPKGGKISFPRPNHLSHIKLCDFISFMSKLLSNKCITFYHHHCA
jgi:hypothetical protein